MDAEEDSRYILWAVSKLKKEFIVRGASTRGRKTYLIERLLAYDRNNNFKSDPVILPTPLEVSWSTKVFQQLTEEHRNLLPSVYQEQIDLYFVYRLAGDKQCCEDFKAIEKCRLLFESDQFFAVSFLTSDNSKYFSGIVGATMKNKVSYKFKIKLDKETEDILNSHCECPAGRFRHRTCKHIAAVIVRLCLFSS